MTIQFSGASLSGISITTLSTPQLSSPSTAAMNTTATNNMGSDGFSWASSSPLMVDKYGCLLTLANVPTNVINFVFSNDNGATWSDASLSQPFITRGAAAYDSANDILHILWQCEVPTDGILYRRYTISRDGSHHITDVTRDTSVNLQLDYQTSGTMTYLSPQIIWLNDSAFGTYGALVCSWSAKNGGNLELRSSMRVLSNDSNDNTASNWKAPITSSSTSIGNAPQVPYTAIGTQVAGNEFSHAMTRKRSNSHALDLIFVYHDANSHYYYTRGQWNSSTHDWSTGLITPVFISNVQRSGTDTGYLTKYQLISHIAEDSNHDRLYVGVATWKDDSNGDTWSFTYIDSSDTSQPLIDLYSAGGAHSYAPTGDVTFDTTLDAMVVSYIKTSTQYAYVQEYQGTSRIQDETVIENSLKCDIPTLYYGAGSGRINNKLMCMYRNTDSPYHGYITMVAWS